MYWAAQNVYLSLTCRSVRIARVLADPQEFFLHIGRTINDNPDRFAEN